MTLPRGIICSGVLGCIKALKLKIYSGVVPLLAEPGECSARASRLRSLPETIRSLTRYTTWSIPRKLFFIFDIALGIVKTKK
jgi:hypothetical protein